MPEIKPPVCETLNPEELAALPLLERVLAYTRPGAPLHSMLACAFELPDRYPAQYRGKASVTSDGFVMCDFVSLDGEYHMGAFVAPFSEYRRNVLALVDHLLKGAITDDERPAVLTAAQGWISADYSGRAKLAA